MNPAMREHLLTVDDARLEHLVSLGSAAHLGLELLDDEVLDVLHCRLIGLALELLHGDKAVRIENLQGMHHQSALVQ